MLGRTRFGFDLRATGRSESAAVASGVNVQRMVVIAMLLSGAVAGLVGMPQLLGASYSYSLDFPAGLGFTGIAIALLGRNHPIGIAFGALLWAYLDVAVGHPATSRASRREIVTIMQGSSCCRRRHRLRAGPPLPAAGRAARGSGAQLAAATRRPTEVAA